MVKCKEEEMRTWRVARRCWGLWSVYRPPWETHGPEREAWEEGLSRLGCRGEEEMVHLGRAYPEPRLK